MRPLVGNIFKIGIRTGFVPEWGEIGKPESDFGRLPGSVGWGWTCANAQFWVRGLLCRKAAVLR